MKRDGTSFDPLGHEIVDPLGYEIANWTFLVGFVFLVALILWNLRS